MKRFLSLGAGVQSSTIALMMAKGELQAVDAAIFSDTQWEPPAVYEWLAWLEQQLPFPVHRVTAGNLRSSVLAKQNSTGGRYVAVPWFITQTLDLVFRGGRARTRAGRFARVPKGAKRQADGSFVVHGMGRRQCTKEFKVEPLLRKKRELLGLQPYQRVREVLCETLIGISIDEAFRVNASHEAWNRNVYPLIDRRMSRDDCRGWMERNGYRQAPKSACVACPFHDHAQWASIMADPAMRADVLEIDESIRQSARGMQFMHQDRKPMVEIDFSQPADHGQESLFNNECEGMCGV